MINRIQLENFKCFSHLDIPLGMLNVFAGINGMGKSTTIQALLLLKQSQQQNYTPERIALNGDYTCLGAGKDLLFENAEKEAIGITLFESGTAYRAEIRYDARADLFLSG